MFQETPVTLETPVYARVPPLRSWADSRKAVRLRQWIEITSGTHPHRLRNAVPPGFLIDKL